MPLLNLPRLIASLVFMALMVACGGEDPNAQRSPAPVEQSVTITSPAPGAQIGGNVVNLAVETAAPHESFHVYVDQTAVAPGEPIGEGPGIVDFTGNTAVLPGLRAGRHQLTIVLGDGRGSRAGSVSGKVEFDVLGPSVRATAPTEASTATGFTVDAVVEGVEILAPNRDRGGPAPTGHLHYLIDPPTPPSANGQPIPDDARNIHSAESSYTVAGLPAGEHTVWVVVGDVNHVPLNPLVADKVTVTLR